MEKRNIAFFKDVLKDSSIKGHEFAGFYGACKGLVRTGGTFEEFENLVKAFEEVNGK